MPEFAAWNPTRAAEIVRDHADCDGPTLPALQALQDVFGYIPDEAVVLVADILNLTRAEVHGVVSFYHDFRREPPARHVLKLCRAEACQAMGADALASQAEKSLGIATDEKAGKARVALEATYCLGLCACAPSAMLDGRVIGRLNAERLASLLAEVQR